MIQIIIDLALIAFGVYYYFMYKELKKQIKTSIESSILDDPSIPTGDEPNDNKQVTSVPEKQIKDLEK